MAHSAQVQALQAQQEELIYITEDTNSEEEGEQDKNQELQLSMHALKSSKTSKYTFILGIQVNNHIATALVDTGSTTTFMSQTFAKKELVK